MFYSITDFTMLNPVNLSGFVTLTLWHFVTPQERTHRLRVQRECAIFEFNLGSHTLGVTETSLMFNPQS